MDERIQRIKTENDNERTAAWLAVRELGAGVVLDLADLMNDENREVARAAKNGLWRIVRYSGRPGADAEREAVVERLLLLMNDSYSNTVRGETVWMLSEIGGDESVEPIAALLKNENVREDARMALERIPGEKAVQALQRALKTVPQPYRINVVQSLRARGVDVSGYPCRKLTPSKPTRVKAVK